MKPGHSYRADFYFLFEYVENNLLPSLLKRKDWNYLLLWGHMQYFPGNYSFFFIFTFKNESKKSFLLLSIKIQQLSISIKHLYLYIYLYIYVSVYASMCLCIYMCMYECIYLSSISIYHLSIYNLNVTY